MAHTCTKCSRVNPEEAVFCYFDGVPLNGHGRAGGPVAIGAQAFPNPFVFPSGRTCRSFDELAIACQEEWPAARDLLQQGFLGSFLGGLGRADLALAADEAKSYPDHDRGLDQLLAKLPSHVLEKPKLRAEPKLVTLGTLPIGESRQFDLHLENKGMRLLYGQISVEDCPWLVLGDAPGVSRKIFQFFHELTVPVHVVGKHLRASNKPLEGKLTVESNGGAPLTLLVKAEVPVKPYPGTGVLAGARSPRQVAEKAKANPKGAAPLFENGEVAVWYEFNGWTYPVQGPAASGLGAVQQFFEALGLTPPPRVQINDKSVTLQGNARDSNLRHVLEISTEEKKPIYAHGTSDQPWLEVSRAKLNGRVAQITLTVPSVPNRPGETLTARVKIQSNGNQKFVVPVTLRIGQNFDFSGAEPLPVPILEPEPIEANEAVVATLPRAVTAPIVSAPPPPVSWVRRKQPDTPKWMHAVPAGLLALALLVLIIIDLVRGPGEPSKAQEPEALQTMTALYDRIKAADGQALTVDFTEEMRFGLTVQGKGAAKRLTFDPKGGTNNTIIRIFDPESADYITLYYGREQANFKWTYDRKTRQLEKLVVLVKDRAWKSSMTFQNDLQVTQFVILVPSRAGVLDTCLVYYEIKNISKSKKQKIGMRFMLDTFIGGKDGVPFTIPGRKGFVKQMDTLVGTQVPDFAEVVENPDNPQDKDSVVARLGLKGIRLPQVGKLDDVDRLVLCGHPDNPQANWDWPFQPITLRNDSCAVLYWDDKELGSGGETRYAGFTYGLGALDVSDEGGLAVSVPGTVYLDTNFYVTAYVYDSKPGQKVSLSLPEGLQLADGEAEEKTVDEAAKRTAVYWKVKATKPGTISGIRVKSNKIESRPATVVVKEKSIFG